MLTQSFPAHQAVPGHDTRDFEFAEAFDLGVKRVVQSPTEEQPKLPYTGARSCSA